MDGETGDVHAAGPVCMFGRKEEKHASRGGLAGETVVIPRRGRVTARGVVQIHGVAGFSVVRDGRRASFGSMVSYLGRP